MNPIPRQARNKGEYSVYHVIQRGNERKNIFGSDEDKSRFLDTLQKMKEKYNFFVHGYCIMDNHVHLIINDNGNDISKLIKSINISYAFYFNYVNNRCGHLFQNRFLSEMITADAYLLQVSKYIHNNPKDVDENNGLLDEKTSSTYEQKYDEIIVLGNSEEPTPLKFLMNEPPKGKPPQSKSRNLLDRFIQYKVDILRFMRDQEVPFDNNKPKEIFKW